jgi:hypothetical protein
MSFVAWKIVRPMMNQHDAFAQVARSGLVGAPVADPRCG